MDAIEARNDINACKQEIHRLQSKSEPKYVSDVIAGYKQTLSDNAKIRSAQKLSRLYNSRDKVKEEFEKTHVIGMTDEEADNCDKLRMQYKQIKDAIVTASNQKLK